MPDLSSARLGCLTIGMMLMYRCSEIWSQVRPTSPNLPIFVAGVWFCLLAGLGLAAAAFLSKKPQRLAPWLLGSLLVAQWTLHGAFVAAEHIRSAPTDTVSLSLEAGILTWLGVNPYGYNMVDVLSAYEGTSQSSTPHLGGGQVETLPYPPLHFLVLEPFLGWGLEGARFFYSLGFSLLVITVFFYAPAQHRCLVLLPLVVNPELLHFPFYWASDTVWTLLLAWMLCFWEKPWARAILLGLACSYKQTPWLFAPLLAIRVWKEEPRPWRSVAFLTGVSLATFTLVNLPFAWAHPRAWFEGTFDPMLSPYVPLGRGFSMLMQAHLLPFGKAYFALLTQVTWLLMIWLYFLNYERLRPLLWWFPAAVLFFSYRSLPNYFVYSFPLLAMELSRFEPERLSKPNPSRWYLPLAAWGVAFVALTAYFWPGPASARMRVLSWNPSAVQLEVSNDGQTPMRPNFFVRLDWRTFTWTIMDGPLVLEPGQTAQYSISTELNYKTIPRHLGGQVVLSDGLADNGYRAVVDLPPLPSHRYPRALDSPATAAWSRRGDVSTDGDEVFLAVRKGADYATVTRGWTLPFGELSFELYKPENFPPDASFGLEVSDQSGHRLDVLLGQSAGRGYYQSDHFYKIIPSKPGWSSYTVNLRELYAEAGFPLPNLDRVLSMDMELIDRPITISFMLYSKRTPVQGAGIREVQVEPTVPGRRIADLMQNHREYQSVLADIAARRRLFDDALELYRRAWPLNSAVRTTQEGTFLVVPGTCEFEGRFPLAGWGWGEPKTMGVTTARPFQELLGTIPMLARPGLKIQLVLEPPVPYSIRWDDGHWQRIAPGDFFSVPEEAQIRVLSVIPESPAGLAAIRAEEP